MPDYPWQEICGILWVQAARAGKPRLGLCDGWNSRDYQMRWQTRAFRMQRKKRSLFFATTWELTAALRSWRKGIGPLSLLSKGFDNWKGRSGGYNEGTRRISFLKKTNSRGFWQQGVGTKGIYQKSHSANLTHTSRLMWTFHSSLQSAEEILPNPLKWWQVLLFLLAAKPPSSPNLLQWQCRRKIKGEEMKESLTWLSWIPVTENQVDGSFSETKKASV